MVICPGIIGKDFNPDDSVLDEIVGYIIAAQVRPDPATQVSPKLHTVTPPPPMTLADAPIRLAAQGLMFQFTHTSDTGEVLLPFPWNALLAPLSLIEWLIRGSAY